MDQKSNNHALTHKPKKGRRTDADLLEEKNQRKFAKVAHQKVFLDVESGAQGEIL